MPEAASRDWPKVVIADDSQDALQALLWLVELAYPEAQVRLAQDGRQALELLEDFRPDLLVTDLRMPKLDGIALCRRVQSDPALSHTKILAVSGYDSPETRLALGEAPGLEFVSKPLDPDDLRRRITRILGEKKLI